MAAAGCRHRRPIASVPPSFNTTPKEKPIRKLPMQWAVQNRPFMNPCSGHLPVCAFFSKKIEKHPDKRPIKCLKVNGTKAFHSAILRKAPRNAAATENRSTVPRSKAIHCRHGCASGHAIWIARSNQSTVTLSQSGKPAKFNRYVISPSVKTCGFATFLVRGRQGYNRSFSWLHLMGELSPSGD